MYQAVATSFDPFTATWTKFLHSELVCTSRDAIDALLKDSEKELVKLLSASGNTVPFQGVMEQTFTLRRGGQRRDSISADSMRSDPIVIATPASTLSDTGSRNFVEAEHLVEVPASGESLVDKAPVKETVMEDINKHKHPPPEEEPAEDNWGSWGVSKTKKNGGKKADPEPPKVEPIVEEPAPLEDEWSFGKKKDKKKKSKRDVVVEEQIEEPAADIVPDDDFGWGSFGKKKDKKKKDKSDVVEEQIEEPADDDFGWASFGKKDTKKKKGKAVVEEPPKVEEPVKAPDSEPEDDMGWANAWGKKNKKKGKNMPIEIIDETPAPDPDPVPANDAEDDWGTWGTSKKDKTPPLTPTPPTPPEIESVPDPVEDPKLDELPASSPLPSPSPSASESV
jgi:hypothetical protein